jgi:hypothetical protein
MDTPRIQLGHPYGETPPNTYADFDWVRRNEKTLLEQYGECILIVYQKQVLGTGQTYQEAVEDAERNLPPEVGVITPVLTFLHPPTVIFRGWPYYIKREKHA